MYILIKCRLKPNIFPNRVLHIFSSTTVFYRSDSDGKFWCSTKVDENGRHFGNQNEWGYCEPGCEPRFCETTNNEGLAKFKKCIFPFIFDAKTYTDCTNEGDPGSDMAKITKCTKRLGHFKDPKKTFLQ